MHWSRVLRTLFSAPTCARTRVLNKQQTSIDKEQIKLLVVYLLLVLDSHPSRCVQLARAEKRERERHEGGGGGTT